MAVETSLTIADAARATGVSAYTLRYAELVRAGEGNEAGRLALLDEHRDAVKTQLAEIRRHLAFIERKIAIYEVKLT